MKTFKQLIETVYLPKSPDERRFYNKHQVVTKDYPDRGKTQFRANTNKKKRKADYSSEQSANVYESTKQITIKYKKGPIELDDGSVVQVTSDIANYLNTLFDQLNDSNKTKMTNELMKDTDSFQDVVMFAREYV